MLCIAARAYSGHVRSPERLFSFKSDVSLCRVDSNIYLRWVVLSLERYGRGSHHSPVTTETLVSEVESKCVFMCVFEVRCLCPSGRRVDCRFYAAIKYTSVSIVCRSRYSYCTVYALAFTYLGSRMRCTLRQRHEVRFSAWFSVCPRTCPTIRAPQETSDAGGTRATC